jgi:hypothetical protein
MVCEFPNKNTSVDNWSAGGECISSRNNIYKFIVTIYDETERNTLFNQVYEVDISRQRLVDVVRPNNSNVLFQRSPKITIMDITSYSTVGKQPVLKLHVSYKKNEPPIHVHFKKSDRLSNRKVDLTIPLMSDFLQFYVV